MSGRCPWLACGSPSGGVARGQGVDIRQSDRQPSPKETGGLGLQFSGSGFLTLAVGKSLDGTTDTASNSGSACPCFVADYAQGGIYTGNSWQMGPDSRLGLQGMAATEGGRYSVTAQVVSRGARGGEMDLEWVYGTAELSSQLALQVGRKRLPILSYSEVQDVGYAYPWVRLSRQVYGWDIVNYNGANVIYRDRIGNVATLINVFTGNETVYNGRNYRIDARWTNIVGIEGRIQPVDATH